MVPIFAGECNRIGDKLGPAPGTAWRPAVSAKTKKNKGLPNCNEWPHNVRPEGYYLGAVKDRTKKDVSTDGDKIKTFPCPYDPVSAADVVFVHIEGENLEDFIRAFAALAGISPSGIKNLHQNLSSIKGDFGYTEEIYLPLS